MSIDFGDCVVLGGGTTEHGLVGPSYRVAVRGPVGEVAQVRVNGIDCGLAWAPPYRVEISDALRSGANEIETIVYNTAANALAADEHITRLAAESEARYGAQVPDAGSGPRHGVGAIRSVAHTDARGERVSHSGCVPPPVIGERAHSRLNRGNQLVGSYLSGQRRPRSVARLQTGTR
jgi:hypothetical protein